MRACLSLLLFMAGSSPLSSQADDSFRLSATRLRGLNVGPHRVGFRATTVIDPTRHTNAGGDGTPIGVAMWYPAAHRGAPAMTGLDYRLLAFHQPLSPAERRRFAEGEAETAMGWRHVGIVPLDRAQAAASLDAPGIAIPNAAPAPGRFPLVMVLGGQYYLSTTAELLASHGFIVAAAFRFSDVASEIGTASFTWYLENSVRDAEWVVHHLRTFEHADVSRLGAIGHGGGGLQALLFAMRNTNVTALVNVDAGNFSARTHSQPIPFYGPRLATRSPWSSRGIPACRR